MSEKEVTLNVLSIECIDINAIVDYGDNSGLHKVKFVMHNTENYNLLQQFRKIGLMDKIVGVLFVMYCYLVCLRHFELWLKNLQILR